MTSCFMWFSLLWLICLWQNQKGVLCLKFFSAVGMFAGVLRTKIFLLSKKI